MDRTTQDLAWSCLPEEFREAVRKEYAAILRQPWWNSQYLRGRLRMMRDLFGERNVTSDAVPEAMLTVPRKKVQEEYAILSKELSRRDTDAEDYIAWNYAKTTFEELFGSKCLPDEQSSVPSAKSDVPSSEPKPAEPKFKVGDKVVIIANCKHKGEVTEIIHVDDDMAASYKLDICDDGKWHTDADLEPYTEPEKESRNLSKNIVNCDKQLDNILKDSFSKERRLNIATQIMSAMLSNQKMLNNLASGETTAEGIIKCIVDTTMIYTDALIAECGKGGSHD